MLDRDVLRAIAKDGRAHLPPWTDEDHARGQEPSGVADESGTPIERPALRLVPLAEFAHHQEPNVEALLGEDGNAALSPDCLALTYGDGGTGKTTLMIDGIAHMAAGVDWLGLKVNRPLKIVVIENEGPRAEFRRKLKNKIETWEGPAFHQNVRVLEEPWGSFLFTNEDHAVALAQACDEFGADLIAVGPLITLGVIGAGTPEDVAEFERVLGGFKARMVHHPALWFTHHENKAGDVSGAWERLPDTMLHVRQEGKRRTKVHWRKARHSSQLHDESWTLRWSDVGEGFELADDPPRDVRAELLALWADDSTEWRTATDAAAPKPKGGIGRDRKDVESELDALADEEKFDRVEGPEGRRSNAVCYRPKNLVEP